MRLELLRKWQHRTATLGELSINGVFSCYTLEDEVRAGDIFVVKVKGHTAIPAGDYEVILSFSNRFRRILPEILRVPNFTGIRMHGGNTVEDTEGCPLLGLEKHEYTISNCAPAVKQVVQQMQDAFASGERCRIAVINEWEGSAVI